MPPVCSVGSQSLLLLLLPLLLLLLPHSARPRRGRTALMSSPPFRSTVRLLYLLLRL